MFSRSERRSKISHVMITELFYPHTLNMNRGSLQTTSFGRIQNTVFRKINQKWEFWSRKSVRTFRETGPRVATPWEETDRNGLARTRDQLLKISFNLWQCFSSALLKGKAARRCCMSFFESIFPADLFIYYSLQNVFFSLLFGSLPSYLKGKKECGSFSSSFEHFVFLRENGFISYKNLLHSAVHCTGKIMWKDKQNRLYNQYFTLERQLGRVVSF